MKKTTRADSSENIYRKYLRTIYAESHTQQFYHAYQAISAARISIGDFFVKKGTRSHAVMVVDLVVNSAGEKKALIGQGDTPACQFHLLNYSRGEPWIPLEKKQQFLPLPIRRKMTWDGLRRFTAVREERTARD